ncbi:hypothetical protein JR316_0009807 [Psilocybe cubensis]|uniref:Uncharacterized protein n=2 Tax=Psilocybe cubensis TaxID=181762 RepID=A0ACB8GQ35_PSICU|nr:hypothetical protein JR316_0009807 [Psilocybe cubensis]KAH9477585.1 hypothetical protein JR316_0009807 [Psilocybe cubensis]
MVRKNLTDSEWIFDFRTNPCYSDSDSECTDGETKQPTSTHIDDLDDIDLSNREENVTYKPNPFSIAKINAAYRSKSNATEKTMPRTLGLHRRTSKQKPVQSTIIDGFKTQASKKKTAKNHFKQADSSKSFLKGGISDLAHLAPNEHSDVTSSNTIIKSSCDESLPEAAPTVPAAVDMGSTRYKLEPSPTPQTVPNQTLGPTNAHISTRSNIDPLQDARPGSGVMNCNAPPSLLYNEVSSSSLNHNRPCLSSPIRAPQVAFSLYPSSFSSPLKPHAASYPDRDAVYPLGFREPFVPHNNQESRELYPHRKYGPHVEKIGQDTVSLSVAPSIFCANSDVIREDLQDRSQCMTSAQSQTSTKYFQKTEYVHQHNRKRNITQHDAYNTLNDPDEEWSTLPVRKRARMKSNAQTLPALSKSFRLPGILPLGTTTKASSTAKSGMRVHMYLPPPPNCAPSDVLSIPSTIKDEYDQGHNGYNHKNNSSSVETHDNSVQLPSSSKSSNELRHTPPPDDAHNLDHFDTEVRLNIDMKTMRKRYPEKRAFLREVF